MPDFALRSLETIDNRLLTTYPQRFSGPGTFCPSVCELIHNSGKLEQGGAFASMVCLKESTHFFAPFAPLRTLSDAATACPLPSIPLLPFKFSVRRTPQIVRRSLALFAPFNLRCSTHNCSVMTCGDSGVRPWSAPLALAGVLTQTGRNAHLTNRLCVAFARTLMLPLPCLLPSLPMNVCWLQEFESTR